MNHFLWQSMVRSQLDFLQYFLSFSQRLAFVFLIVVIYDFDYFYQVWQNFPLFSTLRLDQNLITAKFDSFLAYSISCHWSVPLQNVREPLTF